MKDLFPLEAGRWLDAAPEIVQETVTSLATQQVIEQLGKQFTLHIDVLGLLVKLTSYMLIGYAGPEESLRELRAAGIADQQAQQIIDEIRKRIFIPLRERMMKESEAKVLQPVKNTVPTDMLSQGGRPIGIPALGTQQPASHFHLENKIPLRSAPPMTPRTAPPPLKSMSGMARPVMIEAAKAIDNSKLLEDHEEPHIEFGKISTLVPAPARIAPLPQNLPGVIQSRIIPAGARASFIVAPTIESPTQPPASILRFPTEVPMREGSTQSKPIIPTAPIAPVVSSVPPKPYSIDPYREPIE